MRKVIEDHISGQALLIMVLALAVAVTVGLAVVSRTITNIKISTEQEKSARVFSVAEAGIEEALRLGSAPEEPVAIGGIEAQVTEVVQGGGAEYIFPKEVEADDIQTVWLVGHNKEGALDPGDLSQRFNGLDVLVSWGNQGTLDNQDNTPALEVTLFYQEGTEFKTKKFAVDPNPARRLINKFANAKTAGCDLEDKAFAFCQNFDLQIPGVVRYALRLKLLYNDVSHLLGVRGEGGVIPQQGKCYTSCADLPTSGITRCIQHCQPYKTPPGIFDYVLYSSGDLVK